MIKEFWKFGIVCSLTFFLEDSIWDTGYHPPPPPPPPPPPDEPPPPLPELDPGGEDEEDIVEENADPRLEARPVAPWVRQCLPEYQVGEYPCSICA